MLSKKFLTLGLTTPLFLLGCATTEPTAKYVASRQTVNFPSVGAEAEAEIGQTLVSKANLSTYPSITINNNISEYKKQPITNNRWSGNIKIPAGKLVKISENSEGSFYKSNEGYFESAAGRLNYPVGIFVPSNKQNPALPYAYHDVVGSTGYDFGVAPVEYKASTTEVWSKDSFKSELVYGGLSQKTISISYREFIDGTARPAFSQELKYDLGDSDLIGFRGARFQVLKATNTSIRYKMIKPLD